MNAKYELIKHIEDREVLYVRVVQEIDYDNSETIEGTLNEVLPKLDFEYNNGYGGQELTGTIWYADGTWSERGEYDGAEWWEYKRCPPLPDASVQHTNDGKAGVA